MIHISQVPIGIKLCLQYSNENISCVWLKGCVSRIVTMKHKLGGLISLKHWITCREEASYISTAAAVCPHMCVCPTEWLDSKSRTCLGYKYSLIQCYKWKHDIIDIKV